MSFNLAILHRRFYLLVLFSLCLCISKSFKGQIFSTVYCLLSQNTDLNNYCCSILWCPCILSCKEINTIYTELNVLSMHNRMRIGKILLYCHIGSSQTTLKCSLPLVLCLGTGWDCCNALASPSILICAMALIR